jgi:phosphate transport system permease protein
MAEVTDTATKATSSLDLAERRPHRPAQSDSAYWITLYGVSGVFAVICIGFLLSVVSSSMPAWEKYGSSILTGTVWNQSTGQVGALPLIAGTVETAAIALVLAIPIGIGTALSIVFVLHSRVRTIFSSLVEVLAAVPSVVYGLWGLLVLGPWFTTTVEPWLVSVFGGNFPFQDAPATESILLAGCVLFVMVLPLIVALTRDAITTVPNELVEGALSVGATRWQVLRKVVLPGARVGIVGAVTLATARALGETVAIALVIGLNPNFAHSLDSPAATLASIIATEFQDSTPLQVATLGALAVILMAMTFVVNLLGRQMIRRASVKVSAP